VTAALVVVIGGAVFAIGALLGSDVAALEAIPDDADIVIAVDLLQLTESQSLDSLVDTFAEKTTRCGFRLRGAYPDAFPAEIPDQPVTLLAADLAYRGISVVHS
jgi:hypothetical protein